MARVQVVSDDGSIIVSIESGEDEDGESWTTAACPEHGEIEADHSYFEDMIEATKIHLDYQH
jgi:hypothetical protein